MDASMDVLNEIFGSDDEKDNDEEFTGFKADDDEDDEEEEDDGDQLEQADQNANQTLDSGAVDDELENLKRELNDGDDDEEEDGEPANDVDENGEGPSTAVEGADDDDEEARSSAAGGEADGGEADGSDPVAEGEGGDGEEEEEGDQPVAAESSDDEEVDRGRGQSHNADIVYDFDLMMQRKREENYRKRKRKNIDIINDSDDVIADLISQMKQAADDDFELNKARQPATCKIKLLAKIETPLRKIDLREAFLDAGVLSVITDWLTPMPDRSLPNIKVRETMLAILHNFHISDSERLKASGIGKAVMYLSKHPKESKENKASAKSLIQKWSRFIFNLEADFHSISKEEREQRDYDHMAKAKRIRSDSQVDEKRDIPRPGEKGFVPRARVPQPSNRDYVNRPKTSQDLEMTHRGSSKKTFTRFEMMQKTYNEKKKANKAQRAVKISIEGRKM